MLRSAALGLLDFNRVDRFDPNWHRQVVAALAAVSDEYRMRSLTTSLLMTSTMLSNARLTDESRKGLQNALDQDWLAFSTALYPWLPRPKTSAQLAYDDYVKQFGDPRSPEYRARINQATQAYRERRRAALAAQDGRATDDLSKIRR